jgi:23S rRNA pseudouridine2605 synthase
MSETVRLQKYLAGCGIASRRKAEEMISQGRITVDGEVITAMGAQIDPATQEIRLDGKLVTPHDDLLYILLNKPQGYVTTLSDPQGRPIVTSLLHGIKARLFPVGRLDLDTEGALILTNDGELAQKIQHPSHEVTKTYEAQVLGRPAEKMLQKLEHGILLEEKKTAPAKLTVIARQSGTTSIRITIHEGRKRQVRKMFQAIGHPVIHLKRIAYGHLLLQGLKIGKYRFLTPEDLKKIFIKKIPLQNKK